MSLIFCSFVACPFAHVFAVAASIYYLHVYQSHPLYLCLQHWSCILQLLEDQQRQPNTVHVVQTSTFNNINNTERTSNTNIHVVMN